MFRAWLLCLLLLGASRVVLLAQTDTIQTTSGLRYVVLQSGRGPTPGKESRVFVNYVGKFPDGRIFDTSSLHNRPLKVRLGRGEVIPAWEEILATMPAGRKLVLLVPARLAYGPRGLEGDLDGEYKVPPNADLVFEMEMVRIKPK